MPRRHFDATIVRVRTDDGLVGIGSGDTMDGFAGHEPTIYRAGPNGHRPATFTTIETINFHAGRYWPLEVALWDIIGQITGQPVAALFGNAQTRLRAYASCGELKSPAAAPRLLWPCVRRGSEP